MTDAAGGEELEAYPLSVSMTRPIMALGVPFQLAVTFGTAAFGINNMTRSLLWGPALVVPLWATAAVLVRRDYNAVRVFFVSLQLWRFHAFASTWGGLSPPPFPIARGKRFRGIV